MSDSSDIRITGVLRSLSAISREGKESRILIELGPWRTPDGRLHSTTALVRGTVTNEDAADDLMDLLPEFCVASIRASVLPAPESEGCEFVLHEAHPFDEDDPDLSAEATRLAAAAARVPIGRPRFDFWWTVYGLLARLAPEPSIDVLALNSAQSSDWEPVVDGPFRKCENFEYEKNSVQYTIGVRDSEVQGVAYSFQGFDDNPVEQMARLRILTRTYSDAGALQRFCDNGAGAMLYTNQSGSRYAVYFYLSDDFVVHTRRTRFKLR